MSQPIPNPYAVGPLPLTEADIRRIVREELQRLLGEQQAKSDKSELGYPNASEMRRALIHRRGW